MEALREGSQQRKTWAPLILSASWSESKSSGGTSFRDKNTFIPLNTFATISTIDLQINQTQKLPYKWILLELIKARFWRELLILGFGFWSGQKFYAGRIFPHFPVKLGGGIYNPTWLFLDWFLNRKKRQQWTSKPD